MGVGSWVSIDPKTLAGIVIGWFLAQATAVFVYYWRRRHYKKALYEELWDVGRRLATTKKTCATMIQLLTHNALPEDFPLSIPTHVFDKHYADVSIDLTKAERLAFSTIFATIKNLNDDHEILTTLFRECLRDRTKLGLFSSVVNTMYLRASRALLQGKILWESRRNVPVEDSTDWDNLIDKELEDLIKEGKEKTKDEIKQKSR